VKYLDKTEDAKIRISEKQVSKEWKWMVLGAVAAKFNDKYDAWNEGRALGVIFWIAAALEGSLLITYFFYSHYGKKKETKL
jgi:hypothetical protein